MKRNGGDEVVYFGNGGFLRKAEFFPWLRKGQGGNYGIGRGLETTTPDPDTITDNESCTGIYMVICVDTGTNRCL